VQDVKRFKMYRYRCQLLLFIVRSLRDYSFGSPRLDWWLEFPNRRGLYIARCIADCHIANRRAFKGTHAAALSTFAFSACTHAILLIVSGSFVLETSSSCGLVVPMRALPRPMGRHRVPLIFAVDVVVVCPPPSCRGATLTRERKGTRDASEAMTQLRKCYRYYLFPFPRAPAVRPLRSSRTLKLCKRSYLEATLCSFRTTFGQLLGLWGNSFSMLTK